MQVCRICLVLNTKLFSMNENNLEIFYEQLTGLSMSEVYQLPNQLCWECAHRLHNYSQLRTKALGSHNLMMDLLHSSYLTLKHLKSIDRHAHRLTSTLAEKTFNVNHSDLHLHDAGILKTAEELEVGTLEEIAYLQLDLEVKDDTQGSPMDHHNGYNYDSTSSSDLVLAKHKTKLKKKHKNSKKSRNTKESKNSPTAPKLDRRRKPANEVLNEDIFTITDLTLEEQLLAVQKRVETSNYKKSEYSCEKCFKGFLDEEAYKCHVIRHTSQSGPYECQICKVRFKTQHSMRNHASSHVQQFSCKQCSYVTTRRHAAKLHEEYHNGTRYQCPYCHEDFGKFSTYMSHVRIKHPSDFVCELCGYSFVSGKGLAMHKNLKHRFDDRPVPPDGPRCAQCEVRFLTRDALDRHLKLSAKHRDDVDAKDNRVRKRSRRENETEDKSNAQKKETHKKQRPEGPISCEQCDMQLPDSISYYRHFRRAHPDKNRTNYPSMKSKCMCEVCGKMFQSRALLQDHSFTHSDSRQFACAQCGKAFQRKYRLIAHRRLHGARRGRHACAVCAKEFSTTSNMQRHMVSHTGLKPFKCEMCGKCFKHASEKRVHITYVHLKKPWPKRSRGKRREGRQLQQQPPPSFPSASHQDLVQPLGPECDDPKVTDMISKPIYYNLKGLLS